MLSMMAFQATAEGGKRFAVVIDNIAGVKDAPPCKQGIASAHSS
jgi:hypothetical protein